MSFWFCGCSTCTCFCHIYFGLWELPSKRLDKLQAVQNMAARLIARRRKYDHISDVLINLHWLPVSSRITFKIATQTYRCINNCAPVYLSELISRKKFRFSLDLIRPKTKLVNYGDRSFFKDGPQDLEQYSFAHQNSQFLISVSINVKNRFV